METEVDKWYNPTVPDLKRFLVDLANPRSEDGEVAVWFDVPCVVRPESGEQEGFVQTRWHMFPDGAPVYVLEIDPERERGLLAFRSHIALDATLYRAELLDALNTVNFLMESAHFVLDDHADTPILRFYYAVPVEDAPIPYERLHRMTLETMLWVSCLVPELQAVAQGQLAVEAFSHWLYEHSERLFKGAVEERIRWWQENRHELLT